MSRVEADVGCLVVTDLFNGEPGALEESSDRGNWSVAHDGGVNT